MNIKNKQNFFLATAVFFVAIFSFFLLFANEKYSRRGDAFLEIKGNRISVEIAKNDSNRRLGLSGRDTLCRSCGMLFIFPKKQKTAFWMKDMKFNLDIIWISDGKISHIEKNVQKDDQKIMNPEVLTDAVLEVNAGMSSSLGFEKGDEVIFK